MTRPATAPVPFAAAAPGSGLPPRLRPGARLGVLDVTKYFGATSGGIKTYLLEKARYVSVRPDLRQVMVVPGPDDRVDTNNGSRIYALRGPRIPANPPYRFLLATRSFRRIVEHERPDIIEVGSPFFVPWLSRFANHRLNAPMVWYYHANLPRLVGARTPGRGIVSAALRRYVRLLGSRFPAVICGSAYAARELRDCGVEHIAVSPLGVDLRLFTPGRRAWAAETRAARGLPPEPLALYAGRFAGEKRIDVVLDAWPEVERRTGVRLALVGAGPAERRLRAHPYAGRVTWLPYERNREAFADLLAAIDWYVAPGPAETFGLSVAEALASGAPVLSVDEGGGAELVGRSEAGERYRNGEPDDLVRAAAALAGRNRGALGEAGREYAAANHAWDVALERVFAIYGRVRDGLAPG